MNFDSRFSATLPWWWAATMYELSPLDKAIDNLHRRQFERFRQAAAAAGLQAVDDPGGAAHRWAERTPRDMRFLKTDNPGVAGAQSLLAATAAGWKGSRNAEGTVINSHPEMPGHSLQVNHDGSWEHQDEDGQTLGQGDDAESLAAYSNAQERDEDKEDRKRKTRVKDEDETDDLHRTASMHETDEAETYDESGRKLSDEDEAEEDRKRKLHKIRKGTTTMQHSIWRSVFHGPDDTVVTKSAYESDGHANDLQSFPIDQQQPAGYSRESRVYPGGREQQHAVEATDAEYRDAVMTRLGNMRLVIQNPYKVRTFDPMELGSGPDPFLHGDGPLTLSAPAGDRRTSLLPSAGPGRRTDRPGMYQYEEPDANDRGPADEDLGETGYPDVFFGPSNPMSRYNYAPAATRAGLAHIGGVPVAVSKRARVKKGLFSNIVFGDS